MSPPDIETPKSKFETTEVASAASWLGISQTFLTLLKLLLVLVLTRLLTPEDFGLVTTCIAVIAFITMVGGGNGWASALIVSRYQDIESWKLVYTTTLVMSAALGLSLFLMASPIADAIGIYQTKTYLQVLAASVPILMSAEFLSVYMLSKNFYKAVSQIGVASELAATLLAIAAAFYGWGAWALIVQQFSSSALQVLCYTLYASLRPNFRIDLALTKQLAPFAFKATAGEVINFFGVQYPGLMIANGLGASAAGLHGIANRLSSLPTDIVMQSLSRILVPAMVRVKDDKGRAQAILWSGTANSLLVMPVLFGAAALAEPLCSLFLGKDFASVAPLFAMLCLGKALSAPCGGYYSFLRAVDRTGVLFWLLAARSSIMVASTLIGMKYAGLAGASAGLALANIPILVLFSLTIFRMVKITWWSGVRPFLVIILGAGQMAVVAYAIVFFFKAYDIGEFMTLVTAVITGGVFYVLFLILVFPQELANIVLKFGFAKRVPRLSAIASKYSKTEEGLQHADE